jgi:hypothetical protein
LKPCRIATTIQNRKIMIHPSKNRTAIPNIFSRFNFIDR